LRITAVLRVRVTSDKSQPANKLLSSLSIKAVLYLKAGHDPAFLHSKDHIMAKISIKDLIKKTNHVPVAVDAEGEDKVEVRGLSIKDLGSLCHEHKDILQKLISPEKKEGDDTGIDWGKMLDVSPDFCAEVIARGTGASVEEAETLPTGVQIRLLIGIWGASSIDAEIVEGAVKKIIDLLTRVNQTLDPIGLSQ